MIGSSENRVSYNGNGIATEFAYNFIILEKTDIKVLHVAQDGTETLLVSDYYVDMEKSVVLYPGYAPGAEIPEQNRPPILPVGERLVIYREVPITQESALDKHWPFNVVENGLDKLTIICQQMWDRLTRSFYVSEATSTNFDTKIPIEAGKTFRVKDDGTGFEVTEDPVRAQQVAVSAKNDAEKARDAAKLARDTARAWAEENAGTTPSLIGGAKSSKQWSEHIHGYVDTAVEDARIAKETAIKSSEFVGNIVSGELYNIYSSVADMKADTTLMAGQTVKTVGYYEVNDGGGAFYYIRAKLTDDVADGGSLHELANGLVAEMIVENGTVCPEQFGAKGDGISDDTVAVQLAISSGQSCRLSAKAYRITSVVNIPTRTYLHGSNHYLSQIICDGENAYINIVTSYNKLENFTVIGSDYGIKVLSHNNDFLSICVKNSDIGIYSNNAYLCNYINCKITDNSIGVKIDNINAFQIVFEHCKIEQNIVGVIQQSSSSVVVYNNCTIEGNYDRSLLDESGNQIGNGFGIVITAVNFSTSIKNCFFEANGQGEKSSDVVLYGNLHDNSEVWDEVTKYVTVKYDGCGVLNVNGCKNNYTKYGYVLSGSAKVNITGCSFLGIKDKYNQPILVACAYINNLGVCNFNNNNVVNTQDFSINAEMLSGIQNSYVHTNLVLDRNSGYVQDILKRPRYFLDGKDLLVKDVYLSELTGTIKTINQYQTGKTYYWRAYVDGKRNAYSVYEQTVYLVDSDAPASKTPSMFDNTGDTEFIVTSEVGAVFNVRTTTDNKPTTITSYKNNIFYVNRYYVNNVDVTGYNSANKAFGNLYILDDDAKAKLKQCLAVRILDFEINIINTGE